MTAKIISVITAVVLWFVITLNATFTYKVSLPINYAGPSEGFIVTGGKPDEVPVLIKGSGKALSMFSLREIISPERHYALVSLTGLTDRGKHQITLDTGDIQLNDNIGLTVETILDNAFFSIEIDRLVTRNFTVNVDSIPSIRIEKGFAVVGKPLAMPELIVVSGPENILDIIKSIPVDSFVRNRVTSENPVLKARLGKFAGDLVSFDPGIVDLRFTIEPLAQKIFPDVPLTLASFPGKGIPHFTPDTFSVAIEGPESIVLRMIPADIVITVRYQSFLDSSSRGENLVRPEIRFPEGISVTLTPEFTRFSEISAKS